MTGLEELIKIRDEMILGNLPSPTRLVDEYGNQYPTFHAALTQVIEVQQFGSSLPRCVYCDVIGYDYPADKAYAPGHCYSPEGVKEFMHISGVCEWCFDRIMQAPDEDEQEDDA